MRCEDIPEDNRDISPKCVVDQRTVVCLDAVPVSERVCLLARRDGRPPICHTDDVA
jgi:hypothetical protein